MTPAAESALELEATHLALRDIGPWLRDLLEEAGHGSHDKLGAIELAVHELGTNSVDHAGSPDGRLRIEGEANAQLLEVRLIDRGEPFVANEVSVPAEPQVRGYGMMIIEQLAEELRYERTDEGNRWSATFSL